MLYTYYTTDEKEGCVCGRIGKCISYSIHLRATEVEMIGYLQIGWSMVLWYYGSARFDNGISDLGRGSERAGMWYCGSGDFQCHDRRTVAQNRHF